MLLYNLFHYQYQAEMPMYKPAQSNLKYRETIKHQEEKAKMLKSNQSEKQ